MPEHTAPGHVNPSITGPDIKRFHLRALSKHITMILYIISTVSSLCLCFERGVNCHGGSSCEATGVAGELSAAFCKHMSLPHGFVLLPKDVDNMSMVKATMKQQASCS